MDPETNLPMICDTCSGEFHCLRWCPTKAIERGSNQ
jgi:Fe-S-cluster-containing hydrogenase component 2